MKQPSPGSPRITSEAHRSGLVATLCTFIIWGVFPLYLRALAAVSPGQILSHRIVWSCVLVFAWIALRGQLQAVRAALAQPGVRWRLAASAALISVNWLTYVWAVKNGHVVDASLGYFINPLVSVLLGVAVLHEKLNRSQRVAVALAATGVIYLTVVVGRLPWISLALAFSFGMYGLIRKVVAVESVPGLAVETLVLTPLAIGYLAWCRVRGIGAFGHLDARTDALLIGSGVATALPLALFAYGARLIPLSTVGLMQYIGPTLQLLLGITVFGEPFPAVRAWGFAMIWLALAIYVGDGIVRRGRHPFSPNETRAATDTSLGDKG